MTEETAIRIAEALEDINAVVRSGLLVMIGFAIAFLVIAMYKD